MCGWRAAKAATAARTSHPSKGLAAGDPAKMAGSHDRVRGHRAGAAKAFHEMGFGDIRVMPNELRDDRSEIDIA